MEIQGPVYLREYISKKYNKHIYLFGDIHQFNSTCPDKVGIDEFISSIIKSTDEKIDLFLELSFVSSSHPSRIERPIDNYIRKIYNKFHNCFNVSKSECEFKNVRFHYTDVRHLIYEFMIHRHVNYLLKNIKGRDDIVVIMDRLRELMQYIPIDFNQISKYTKIKRQFGKIDEDLAGSILAFFQKIILKNNIKMKKKLKKINRVLFSLTIDLLNDEPDYIISQHTKVISNFMEFLTSYFSFIMDLYLVGRMFNENYRNIIVYTGVYHTFRYDKLLRYLKFKVVNTDISLSKKKFQCIDIQKFIPLFKETLSSK
jgi:hypothetical protein